MPILRDVSILRLSSIIVSVLLILTGFWFVVFHTNGFLVKPENPHLVTIDAITNSDHPQIAKVTDHTAQPCWVLLELNGFPYDSRRSESTFQFDNVIIRPGENNIMVKGALSAL